MADSAMSDQPRRRETAGDIGVDVFMMPPIAPCVLSRRTAPAPSRASYSLWPRKPAVPLLPIEMTHVTAAT